MTAKENLAGASLHPEINWSAINWQQANQTVRRLQARIVKAIEAKRWNKVLLNRKDTNPVHCRGDQAVAKEKSS